MGILGSQDVRIAWRSRRLAEAFYQRAQLFHPVERWPEIADQFQKTSC